MHFPIQNPPISVIIPVYNMADYVGESITSVLNQTFRKFELIIVNDGSTDNSLEIINSYIQKDKRILVIDKPNAGLASAYNAGQQMARGKYIYFLDSDDWMEPNCLEELYLVAEREQAEVVKAGGMISEQNNNHILHQMIPPQKCNKLITNMLTIPEFVSRHVAQWTSLYRRDFLIDNNIWSPEFPPQIAPDIDFMYHVWSKLKRLYIVPKAFIHYRLDNSNSDKNSGAKMSFYLLRGHLIARSTMHQLHLPKDYWYVKTKVEFDHFLYELDSHRCCTNRWAYLQNVSKIFRENLKLKLVNFKKFSSKDAKEYKLIAYAPFLYWLNDVLKIWHASIGTKSKDIVYLYFFGIYRQIENDQYIRGNFLGIPLFERRKEHG